MVPAFTCIECNNCIICPCFLITLVVHLVNIHRIAFKAKCSFFYFKASFTILLNNIENVYHCVDMKIVYVLVYDMSRYIMYLFEEDTCI